MSLKPLSCGGTTNTKYAGIYGYSAHIDCDDKSKQKGHETVIYSNTKEIVQMNFTVLAYHATGQWRVL